MTRHWAPRFCSICGCKLCSWNATETCWCHSLPPDAYYLVPISLGTNLCNHVSWLDDVDANGALSNARRVLEEG